MKWLGSGNSKNREKKGDGEKRGQIYFPESRSIPFVHLTAQSLTCSRIKISLVAQINGITVSPDIIIIEFAAFDEHEAMASVKTI